MNQEQEWLLKEKYNGVESEAFHADCVRLNKGEPLAYVIGYAPFLNCQIHLDSQPLIPRPETEFWVEKAIDVMNVRNTVSVLDLCAGSGAIGVAVAKAVPAAQVNFAEIDPAHLSTIRTNLDANIPDYSNRLEQYKIFVSDLFSKVPVTKYNFILSNPPYIDPAIDRAEKSVRDFEPHRALYGGKNGMELIEKIISIAPTYLKPAGQVWLEHEPEQSKAIQTLATEHGFLVTTHKDQYEQERYSVLVLQ